MFIWFETINYRRLPIPAIPPDDLVAGAVAAGVMVAVVEAEVADIVVDVVEGIVAAPVSVDTEDVADVSDDMF